MYGLPQSGLLANNILGKRLNNTATNKENYYPDSGNTTGDLYYSH